MFEQAIADSAQRALGLIVQAGVAADFYLAGGTALAIQLGHRISYDLDFFTSAPFDPEALATTFKLAGLECREQRYDPGTFRAELAETNVSFFAYPYPILDPFLDFKGMHLAGLQDIGMMKMTAICDRGCKKDFVDLFFILKALQKTSLLPQLSLKFPGKQLEQYHFVRSLCYFDDAEIEPDPDMLLPWDWQTIKDFFSEFAGSISFEEK